MRTPRVALRRIARALALVLTLGPIGCQGSPPEAEQDVATAVPPPSEPASSRLVVTADRSDTTTEIETQGATMIVHVRSPHGIGRIHGRFSGPKPVELVFRLHLRGLERVEFAFGERVLRASGTHGGQLAPPSPGALRVDVSTAIGARDRRVPLDDGYFDVRAPSALLAEGGETFALHFVDFFR